MSLQQAEGWYLWEKSMVMRRQALRQTVASVPRRARLAGILVLLLTAIGLLVTPTFGGSYEEIRKYGHERIAEGIQLQHDCIDKYRPQTERILECQKEGRRIVEEGAQCVKEPESCGAILCNSQKFKACLARTAKEFERMYYLLKDALRLA